MWFVYALQINLVFWSMWVGVWSFANPFFEIMLLVITFLVHELLHVVVIYPLGNISFTYSNLFFWLNTDAVMTKKKFLLFVSLPFVTLTVLPGIISLFLPKDISMYFKSIAWMNSIIAGADIINILLILAKPRESIFYRGYIKRC